MFGKAKGYNSNVWKKQKYTENSSVWKSQNLEFQSLEKAQM